MSSWHQLERQQQEACWWPCCEEPVVARGVYFGGVTTIVVLTTYVYDAVLDSYSGGGNIAATSEPHRACAHGNHDGVLYATQGFGASAGVGIASNAYFDINTNTWYDATDAPASTSHAYGNASSSETNGWHVFGGGISTTHRSYDAGSWTSRTAYSITIRGPQARAMPTETILAGGLTTGLTETDTAYSFDSTGDSFSALTVMTEARRYGSFIHDSDDLLWYTGGQGTSGVIRNTNYEYSISGDSWTTKTAMTQAKTSHAGMTLGDRLHVLGGFASSQTDKNYQYDSAGDSWTEKATMSVAQYEIGYTA